MDFMRGPKFVIAHRDGVKVGDRVMSQKYAQNSVV